MLVTKNNDTTNHHHQVVVVGVGGAGLHVLDRLVLRGLQEVRMIALDTDSRMLGSSVVEEKIQLGRKLTRGLDSGGDPELGSRAATESSAEFLDALADANLIFLIAGLGGGTGSGALPQLARMAAEKGAKIVSLVTLPFEFEGRRRIQQAQAGVDDLVTVSDALYVLPNDAVMGVAEEERSVFEAFEVSDDVLGQISRGLCHMLVRKGFLSVDWPELVRLFEPSVREPGRSCWIGWGEDATENRARAVVEMILNGPFLGRQEIREQTDDLLVSITGGSNMLFSEVEYVVRELREVFPHNANLRLATRLDEERGDDLSVLVIAAKTTLRPYPGMPPKSKPDISPASFRKQLDNAPDFAVSENAALTNSPPVSVSESLDSLPPATTENEPGICQTDLEETHQNKSFSEQAMLDAAVSEKRHIETDVYSESSGAVYTLSVTDEPEISLLGNKQEEPIQADPTLHTAYLTTPTQNEPFSQFGEEETFSSKPQIAKANDPSEQHSEFSSANAELTEGISSRAPTEPTPTNEVRTAAQPQIESRSPARNEPELELFSDSPTGPEPKKLPKVEFAAIPSPFKLAHRPENTNIVSPTPPETQQRADQSQQQHIDTHPDQNHPQTAETARHMQADTYFTREPEVKEPATVAAHAPRQETLQFEAVSVGRFEKTDATLHNGENLDIPTYLRKQLHIRQVIE